MRKSKMIIGLCLALIVSYCLSFASHEVMLLLYAIIVGAFVVLTFASFLVKSEDECEELEGNNININWKEGF